MARLTVSLLLAIATLTLSAQTIDRDRSYAQFKISNMALNSVKGTFTGMTGSIDFDPANPTVGSFDVCVRAETVDSGNKKRDDHLRKSDFFNVAEYPTICFRSTSITRKGSGYLAKGQLTMHGTTRSVELPFTYRNGTYEGELEIKRLDYGLGEGTGTFMVGNTVKLDIVCVVR